MPTPLRFFKKIAAKYGSGRSPAEVDKFFSETLQGLPPKVQEKILEYLLCVQGGAEKTPSGSYGEVSELPEFVSADLPPTLSIEQRAEQHVAQSTPDWSIFREDQWDQTRKLRRPTRKMFIK